MQIRWDIPSDQRQHQEQQTRTDTEPDTRTDTQIKLPELCSTQLHENEYYKLLWMSMVWPHMLNSHIYHVAKICQGH